MMLTLPTSEKALKQEGEIFASRREGPPKTIVQAGKGYAKLQGKAHRAMQRKQIAEGVELKDDKGNKLVIEDSDEEADGSEKKNANKKKKKTKEEIEKAAGTDNLYEAIGLDGDEIEVTEMEVIKAYKNMALMFHPDKLGRPANDHDKEVWLQVQEAYDTLINPAKKRRYDSTLDFDDKLPEISKVTDENFFELYGECFERNARFSELKPVPTIGDKDTPMDDVDKFYKFWDDFKTWREFTQHDEHDPNDAQDRFEKRWMEQQNIKGRKGYQKEERKRLMKLYSQAYERDPRVKAQLAKEKAEIENAKNAKKLAKQQRWQAEQDKLKATEVKKVEEEAKVVVDPKVLKEEKRLRGKLYRETVKKLIGVCVEKMPGTLYDKFYCDELVKKYPTKDVLDELITKVENIVTDGKDVNDVVTEFLTIAGDTARLEKHIASLKK